MELVADNAIDKWRALIGPTNTLAARQEKPDSLRAYFGTDGTKNAVHGSDSRESVKKESGLVRIRFIINCQGKTDRFRILSVDENYKAKEFDKNITEQLLQITKRLDGWKPKKYKEKEVNYYQYLIFKLVKGQLIEVLP